MIPGNSDCIRSANVKKSNGNFQLYSIKHLYPLEVRIAHYHQTNITIEENKEYKNNLNTVSAIATPSESYTNPRPRRKIKILCERNDVYH